MALKFGSVTDCTVFVTGGASGIGFGIAEAAGRAGANVMIADIEVGAIPKALETLRSSGIEAEGCVCDVRSLSSMQDAAEATLQHFGQVDLVCNNAGVICELDSQDWTDQGWQWVIDVNLMGIVHGVQAFRSVFAAQRTSGYFVNTVSQVGFYGSAFIGQYSASKFAALGLTESLREELAQENIGVSAFCAGAAPTNILTASRNAPADVKRSMNSAQIDVSKVETSDAGSEHLRQMTTPLQMGELLLAGAARGDMYIFTDQTAFERIYRRFDWLKHAQDQVQKWEENLAI